MIPDQLRNGADYDTLHQVWFRARELSQSKLESRQKKIVAILLKMGQEVEGASGGEEGKEACG